MPKRAIALSYIPFASYQAEIGCSRTITLPTLWEVQQKLSLSIGNDTCNLNLNGEHYRNELSPNEYKETWLADIGLQYNTGKWRWTAGLTNLFNQKEYRQTTYSDIRSHASWMKIRPREMMVSIQYRW